MKRTLYEKIRRAHLIHEGRGETPVLYIDRHLIHEVTSPVAFSILGEEGLTVRRPETCLAVVDHVTPTVNREKGITDPLAAAQVKALAQNCEEAKITFHDMDSPGNGITHVVAPETGFVHPGMTLVCGDSHTATHGAFGALAFGIGTSEVARVLSTQCLPSEEAKTMSVEVDGSLRPGVTAKDMALAVIRKLGTAGATGHVIEFRGKAVRDLSMEGRMTLCNMAVEAGARAGMIAPDETTFSYLSGKPHTPTGEAWQCAKAYWKTLVTDEGASFDARVRLNGEEIEPLVTWGTSPEQVTEVSGKVPDPDTSVDEKHRETWAGALSYMGLSPGTPMGEIPLDNVFIGSCTNGRIEDLREAAGVVRGRKVAAGVTAMVVPGSVAVKEAAEQEGLDVVFKAAGFQWREPGCSMCLAMNDDFLLPEKRCASTSNRNFRGRQGEGSRTHLVSPRVAAASAVAGRIVSPDAL